MGAPACEQIRLALSGPPRQPPKFFGIGDREIYGLRESEVRQATKISAQANPHWHPDCRVSYCLQTPPQFSFGVPFMRSAILVALGVLLSMHWGAARRQHPREDEAARQTGRTRDVCSNLDDDTNHPISMDDAAIKRRIELEGGALIEQGRTTEMDALRKQLGLERCELEVAPQSTAPFDNNSLLFAQAKPSVVVVSALYKCQNCDQWHANSATGFVISASGAIVTNYHVADVADKKTIVVMTADGEVLPVKKILAASRVDDLAILQVEAENLSPLPIALEAEPVGGKVSVISHPVQQYYCYTNGVVSRYKKVKMGNRVVDAMTITADYARGSSGAPVLNDRGEVVGIVMSTESVYYTVEDGRQENLQMVFKTCIPSTSLLGLITSTAGTPSPAN